MVRNNQFSQEEVFHPGETLKDKLDEMGISVSVFSHECKCTEGVINDIISGRKDINQRLAEKFEDVLGISSYFWMSRQQEYNEYIKR